MVAEAVSLDGGAIFLILLALFVTLASTVGVVAVGFVAAVRAGRGSIPAQRVFVFVVIVEALVMLLSVPSLFDGSLFVLLPAAVLAGHIATYRSATRPVD